MLINPELLDRLDTERLNNSDAENLAGDAAQNFFGPRLNDAASLAGLPAALAATHSLLLGSTSPDAAAVERAFELFDTALEVEKAQMLASLSA